MADVIRHYTHLSPSPATEARTAHPNRRSAQEALESHGGYCTMVLSGNTLTKKANGGDIGDMLEAMSRDVQGLASKAHRSKLKPKPEPEKESVSQFETLAYGFGRPTRFHQRNGRS